MSVHIMCLTSAGGLPIFTRKKGDGDNFPYSVVGSLNGIHMFSKSQNIEMLHTLTQNHNVVWKEFIESIVLIGISTGSTVPVLNKLLESVFNAMVLISGLDELKTQRNIERLKRELKFCYPIIDKLLDSVDYGDSSSHSSDLIGLSETILCQENHLIQIVINSFAECVETLFACVLIHGKIAVATENWWELNADERKLLAFLGSMEHDSTAKDYPVFLPHKSPNIAFRLVSCTLIADVVVCCLLGQTPTLEEVEQTACQCFKTTMEILRSAVEVFPRNFPSSIQLDTGILGFLLINRDTGKYILSRNPHHHSKKRSHHHHHHHQQHQGGSHRLDILRTFYYQAVETFLQTDTVTKNTTTDNNLGNVNITSAAHESYWCSEYHKCHAAKIHDNIICVLYAAAVPTHAMRLTTQTTLRLLICDKQLCW